MSTLLVSKARMQRGVTLLEALVALVVLSLGLLGIAKLNAYLVATAGQSKARMEAVALAERKLEEFRNQVLENEQYKVTFTSANFALYSQTAMDDATKVKCSDTAQSDTVTGLLASYTRSWCSLGASMQNQVMVYVVWKDNANVKQSVSLQSVIAWDSPLKSVAFANAEAAGVAGLIKPPTGRAHLGEGTVSDVAGGVTSGTSQGDGLTIVKGNTDNLYRLIDSSGNVLMTADAENETLSVIAGNVYVDQVQLNSLARSSIYVAVSDASYCSMLPSATYTNLGAGDKYKYFSYRCYLGAAWYGNIGVIRVDNANANDRVCVGDPNVTAVSFSTDSDSRHPALASARAYRGYKESPPNSGLYVSTGIGIDSNGAYTAATYDGHDFLLTNKSNPTDSDCLAKLKLYSTANPNVPFGTDAVTATPPTATTASPLGNPGKFFCFSSSCPSPLPGGAPPDVSITVSGSISRLGSNPKVSASSMTIDSGTCTIANSGNSYSCTITLVGWTGATWSGDMTVNTAGYVCHNGATGPGTPPASNAATSGVISFANQSVNVSPVTQNFSLGKAATDCP